MTNTTQPSRGGGGTRETAWQAVSYFEHRGLEIRCVFSPLSGREYIYVDDKLVSESRNWRAKSTHVFEVASTHYAVETQVKTTLRGLLAGAMTVKLRANGEVVDCDEFSYAEYAKTRRSAYAPFTRDWFSSRLTDPLIYSMIAGFIAGLLGSRYFF